MIITVVQVYWWAPAATSLRRYHPHPRSAPGLATGSCLRHLLFAGALANEHPGRRDRRQRADPEPGYTSTEITPPASRTRGSHTQRVLGVRCEDGPLRVTAPGPASPKKESTEKTKISNKESVETPLHQLTQDLIDVRKRLKELTDRTMMIQKQINQLSKND